MNGPLSQPTPFDGTRSGLVGRQSERALLERLLDQAAGGQGNALVISGGAGIGKSALLTWTRDSATRRNMTVLTALGVESESRMPFAGLHQLLLPLRRHAHRLEPGQRRALRSAFDGQGTVPDLFSVALATLELLTECAAQAPVLAVADDTQWLDRPSADVLAFVARRVAADPVLVLSASRTGHPDPLRSSGLSELALHPLESTAARALLATSAPHLTQAQHSLILSQSAGNPLALVELPKTLTRPNAPAGQPRDLLPLNERLELAFGIRYTDLPADSRTLLLAASADTSCDLPQLLRAAAIAAGAPVGTTALQPAVDQSLIGPDTLRVHFRHPLIRSAVYTRATVAERLAIHAALSVVLETEPDRQVWHRAAATLGTDEDVVSDLEAFAARARPRGAVTIAVTALERGSDLTAAPARRTSLLLRAAELASELGERRAAAELVRRSDATLMSPEGRGRLAVVQEIIAPGEMLDQARVRALLEAARAAQAGGHPDLAAELLWRAASRCWWGNLHPDLRTVVADAVHHLSLTPGAPRTLAIQAYALPHTHGSSVLTRMATLTPDRSDADVMRFLGGAALILGDFHTASTYMGVAAETCRSQGRLALLARTLGAGSWGRIWTGDWDRARSESEEAATLAKETGETFWATSANTNLAMLAALRGEHDIALTLAQDAQDSLNVSGVRFLLHSIQQVRAVAAIGTGRYEEAYDILRRLFDPSEATFHEMRWWVAPDLADAAAHTGRQEEARIVLAGLEPLAGRLSSPMIHMCLQYTQAVLAEDEDAEVRFKQALAGDPGRWPPYRARLLLAHSRRLRRQRRTVESRAPLREARDIFDTLGAPYWSDHTRELLRSAGESSTQRPPAARDRLSPQELQIATLAATGLTNRQISQRLYLSHRTIGSHLYRIFPKLGITTRTQLADTLNASEPSD
ncbi:ATP-binding protein [Streptomyces sp. NPDC058398]|uniref:ATP-binding protein n=1 Tax=Streptomyces sp. NPDC058398 TaxID=3346479 RepID=UPI003646275C